MMTDYVFVLCLLYGTFKFSKERQLMDEVTRLKEEIQIKSSEKPQGKAEEKAPDTREYQPRKPRKGLVRDPAVTNCVEFGQMDQVTKESEAKARKQVESRRCSLAPGKEAAVCRTLKVLFGIR